MMLEAMNHGLPGYATGEYVTPTYVRTSGSAVDTDQLTRAMVNARKQSPVIRDVVQQNDIKPVVGIDPQTAITILGRELSRSLAGVTN